MLLLLLTFKVLEDTLSSFDLWAERCLYGAAHCSSRPTIAYRVIILGGCQGTRNVSNSPDEALHGECLGVPQNPAIFNKETPFISTSLGIAHTPKAKSMSVNGQLDELLSKSKDELLLLAKRLLPPKLWPHSSSSKAAIANAIQKARRQSKILSFFAAVPTSKASTSTASTVSSSSPAKKKSKPADCINEEIASVISGSTKSDEAKEAASVISGSAKSDEAKEEDLYS